MSEPTIFDGIENPELFRRWFRDPTTWRAWFIFLRALFGIPLSEEERLIFEACTGLGEPPEGGVQEAWLICGRRSGKSLMLALIAVFLATFRDWRPYLSPGERGTIMVVAADRRQARAIYRYAHALLSQVPVLARTIKRVTAESIDLENDVTLEILTASFRTVRGYTLVAALCDELAFWRSEESANPDVEILAAIRPAMATVPRSMLLCASSPYARRGALWNAYRQHYGKPGPVLVWRADTRTMNPTVPQSVIDEATERDPESAAAEYGAEFRRDVETFVAREIVEAAVVPGRRELAPIPGLSYVAFVDPSGGSSDSMTLAIGHEEDTRCVLDAVREIRPPFSPETVVAELAQLLKTYRLSIVRGDRYAGEWPRDRFRQHGIDYQPATKSKSDLYRELLPILNSGRLELLDHPRLISQLCALERRTARGGRDSIDHPAGGHDDVTNAAAGVAVTLLVRPPITSWGLVELYRRESERVTAEREAGRERARPKPQWAVG
jgi:hypothetical protein